MNIKFSSTLPTVPGAYWVKSPYDVDGPKVCIVDVDMCVQLGTWRGLMARITDYQFSERLVPVSRVADAYSEGVSDGFRHKSGYDYSTARKIVEGTS